jgi:hypothetical protein
MHLRAVGLILSCVHNEILAGVVRILQKEWAVIHLVYNNMNTIVMN